MKHSLLYAIEDEHCDVYNLDQLEVEKLVALLSADININRFTVSVLSKPLRNLENIRYRQEICKDFFSHPELAESLSGLFEGFNKIKTDWENDRRINYSMKRLSTDFNDNAGNREGSLVSMIEYARFCLKFIALPETLVKILSGYFLHSAGLQELTRYCNEMSQSESFLRLRSILRTISEIMPHQCSFEMIAEFDEKLRFSGEHIVRIGDLYTETKSTWLKKSKPASQEAKESSEEYAIPFNIRTSQEMNILIGEAVDEISACISRINKDFYLLFSGYFQEIQFYKFAIILNETLVKAKLNVCFPDVRPKEENGFHYKQLMDLLLAADHISMFENADRVVSNDMEISENGNGILIKGANDSGKTVLLRSIGLAQIFAQAGLPIIAGSAVVSVRNCVFMHFSQSEKTLPNDDITGRFEFEVKEMDTILNQIQPYSLLLLNEIFQTTAYAEGAVAIADILNLLSECGIQWLFVTHLPINAENMERAKIRSLQADPNDRYRFKEIES